MTPVHCFIGIYPEIVYEESISFRQVSRRAKKIKPGKQIGEFYSSACSFILTYTFKQRMKTGVLRSNIAGILLIDHQFLQELGTGSWVHSGLAVLVDIGYWLTRIFSRLSREKYYYYLAFTSVWMVGCVCVFIK
jgi:hypothetical protein